MFKGSWAKMGASQAKKKQGVCLSKISQSTQGWKTVQKEKVDKDTLHARHCPKPFMCINS